MKKEQTRFVKQALSELEAKARAKNLTVYGMCKLAQMQPATYYHWRSGLYSPTLMAFGKLHEAIDNHNG